MRARLTLRFPVAVDVPPIVEPRDPRPKKLAVVQRHSAPRMGADVSLPTNADQFEARGDAWCTRDPDRYRPERDLVFVVTSRRARPEQPKVVKVSQGLDCGPEREREAYRRAVKLKKRVRELLGGGN